MSNFGYVTWIAACWAAGRWGVRVVRAGEEALERVASLFDSAALGLSDWDAALAGLSDACGGRSGQLIGVGPSAMLFNHVTNLSVEGLNEFAEIDGGDPRVNRRLAAGMRNRELVSIAEADFAAPEDLARDPFYEGFLRKWDMPFICAANLLRRPDMLVGLAVLRSARQGHIEAGERAIFDVLAPRVQGAVLTRQAIDTSGVRTLLGGMDAVSLPVFLFDAGGRVASMSAAAEELVSAGVHLRLRDRRLGAAIDRDSRRLAEAVARASSPQVSITERRHTTLALAHADGGDPLIVEIAPFPDQAQALGFTPRCIAVVRNARDADAGAAHLIHDFYGLTQAEAEVGIGVARGLPVAEIARRRHVSPGTVRNQIKTLFLKMGVKRQLDLAKKLDRFLD